MSKTESITTYFKVYVHTSVPEAKPYLDKLTDEPSLLPNHDDLQSIFGKDTRKISDTYMDALDIQFEVTKAVLNRAIHPNFDVYEMGFGTTDHMGYVFNGVQNTLQFVGCMEVVVGLEIPHETTPLTRTNEIDRLARMVESTLAQMRESCGINATCGEMITASRFLYVSTAGRVFLRTQGAFPAVFVYRRNVQNVHSKIAISEPFISYMKQRSYNVKICSI